MQIDRIKRVNEIIRRELATSLMHVGQGEGAEVMRTREQADELMRWLRRHRVEFQSRIAKDVSLKYTPKLFFKQTQAIEKGDHVLDILKEIGLPQEGEVQGSDGSVGENAGNSPEQG